MARSSRPAGTRTRNVGRHSRSNRVALAWPPPSHISCSPRREPLRSSSPSRVAVSRAPEAAERMAERDGAPVDVDPLHVGVHLVRPREHDAGERLVDLDAVDRVERDAGALEDPRRRRDRRGEHEDGVVAGERERDDTRARREPEADRRLFAGDQDRSGAVADLRRVAGGDHAVGLERRLQRGEAFGGGVGPDSLVGRHRARATVDHDRHRHELAVEPCFLRRACGAQL